MLLTTLLRSRPQPGQLHQSMVTRKKWYWKWQFKNFRWYLFSMPCIINYLMNTTDDLFFSDCFEALISTMTSIKSWISSLPHCWIQFQFNPANIEEVWSLDWIMRLRCAEGQQGRDLDKEIQCHRHHLLLMSENLMFNVTSVRSVIKSVWPLSGQYLTHGVM